MNRTYVSSSLSTRLAFAAVAVCLGLLVVSSVGAIALQYESDFDTASMTSTDELA
jgi:hypothetical protein